MCCAASGTRNRHSSGSILQRCWVHYTLLSHLQERIDSGLATQAWSSDSTRLYSLLKPQRLSLVSVESMFSLSPLIVVAIYSTAKAHKPWYWFVIHSLMLIISVGVIMPFCLSRYVTAAFSGSLVSDRLILKSWIRQLHREVEKPFKYACNHTNTRSELIAKDTLDPLESNHL